MYRPLVAALAFILTRQRTRLKMAGITLPVVLMGAFILYTSKQVAKVTGQGQISAFGSWKIANDALYAYAHVLPGNTDTVPEKFRALDNKVRRYFRTSRDRADILAPDFTSGSLYMFAIGTPLVGYMDSLYGTWTKKRLPQKTTASHFLICNGLFRHIKNSRIDRFIDLDLLDGNREGDRR